MVKNTKTVYEIIQNIPVESMIALSFTQLREFEVIDSDGVSHKFPYTHKRKISGVDGVRLQIKEEGV